jgi:hypothetical protein
VNRRGRTPELPYFRVFYDDNSSQVLRVADPAEAMIAARAMVAARLFPPDVVRIVETDRDGFALASTRGSL